MAIPSLGHRHKSRPNISTSMRLPETNCSSSRASRAYFLGFHKEEVTAIQWLVWTVGVAFLVDLIAAVTFKRRDGRAWIRDVRLVVDIQPQHKIRSTQENRLSSRSTERYRLHLIRQVTPSHNPKIPTVI